MPSISIVIPSYINSVGLEQCLRSIREYTDLHTHQNDIDIVVVANGAPVETKDIVANAGVPSTLLWFEQPQGFSKAVNAGIREARGELIILLNDDCVLLPQEKNHWIDLLLRPHLIDPKVGITGSHKLWDPDTQHEFIIFFCAMLRRTMIDEIGALDESFSPFYGEDISMCIEAERAGWKWVQVPVGEECRLVEVPDSEHLPEWKRQRWVGNFPIAHDGETTLGQLPNHVEVVERNRALLRERYGISIERAKQIEGWMSDSELHYLATEAKTHKTIVEIGSWLGRSTRALVDNLPAGGRVYAIDSWDGTGDDPAFAFAKEYGGNGAFIRFYKNLWDHIDAGRVVPIRMSSLAASKLMRQLRIPVNMLFVDGEHTREAVTADLTNWRPLLTPDALLCGHDYTSDWPGVIEAVDSLIVAEQVPNTGIWRALDVPLISPSVGEYGGMFA
jgi:hypothetical protein